MHSSSVIPRSFSPPTAPEVPSGGVAGVKSVACQRFSGDAEMFQRNSARAAQDWIAEEEPLEIRIAGVPIAVIMRSPGHDEELVTGFLLTENIAPLEAIERIAHCSIGEHPENVMQVTLRPDIELDLARLRRRLYTTSSCGICGKASAQTALQLTPAFSSVQPFSGAAALRALGHLRGEQAVFALTGGTHAAALLNQRGDIVLVREDIGRHNAVDKLVGASARQGLNLASHALLLSGRASFEMIQKSLAARIPTVIAVGAVSSLAVETAKSARMTLVGFCRAQSCNVYTGALI